MTVAVREASWSARPVEDAEFERMLATAVGEAVGPKEGLFGRPSMVWKVSREVGVFLGAGRAALLQLAHPWVAQAIADHSSVRTRPVTRFQRTFRAVYSIVYGNLAAVQRQARAMRKLHALIKGELSEAAGPFEAGSPYFASEGRACAWVYATLADTSLRVFQRLIRPLSDDEINQYLAEFRRFGLCFGAPEDLMPTTGAALADFMDDAIASGVVTVTTPAREVAADLFDGVKVGPFWYAPPWYRDVTIALLPPHVREGFGFEFTDRQARRAEKALDRSAHWLARTPYSFRYVGPYHEAHARLFDFQPRLLHRMSARLMMGKSRW